MHARGISGVHHRIWTNGSSLRIHLSTSSSRRQASRSSFRAATEGKDEARHGNHPFGVETISGRRDHHGDRVWVLRSHHEPLGHLGASNRGANDREPAKAEPVPEDMTGGRYLFGPFGDTPSVDDRGDGTGRLGRLSQLGHGRARARARGRADRDRDLVLHGEWRVQRPVPLGRVGHRGRGRRRRGGRSDRRRPGGRAPRQHLLHVISRDAGDRSTATPARSWSSSCRTIRSPTATRRPRRFGRPCVRVLRAGPLRPGPGQPLAPVHPRCRGHPAHRGDPLVREDAARPTSISRGTSSRRSTSIHESRRRRSVVAITDVRDHRDRHGRHRNDVADRDGVEEEQRHRNIDDRVRREQRRRRLARVAASRPAARRRADRGRRWPSPRSRRGSCSSPAR